jgi:hypothetical protein
MHDQRVVGGAAFGGKYVGYRSIVRRIGTQPIDRLGC